MTNWIESKICEITNCSDCQLGPVVQELWSGYGVIQRATIDKRPVIIKVIDASEIKSNRRGWKSDFAHQRKIRSYDIESNFYETYSVRCTPDCRVANLLGSFRDQHHNRWILVLEDLDAAGFARRAANISDDDLKHCLNWLANFHACFLGLSQPDGLWAVGTYWHLDTRPDEHQAMQEGTLKNAAQRMNEILNNAKYKTLVHGDAKIANFCLGAQFDSVAAVDFQYVGGGVGVKDLAYFISSCLDETEAERREDEILEFYFQRLHASIERQSNSLDANAVENEWRRLYPFAWADFCRFLQGWSPGHWKLNGYSRKLTEAAINQT